MTTRRVGKIFRRRSFKGKALNENLKQVKKSTHQRVHKRKIHKRSRTLKDGIPLTNISKWLRRSRKEKTDAAKANSWEGEGGDPPQGTRMGDAFVRNTRVEQDKAAREEVEKQLGKLQFPDHVYFLTDAARNALYKLIKMAPLNMNDATNENPNTNTLLDLVTKMVKYATTNLRSDDTQAAILKVENFVKSITNSKAPRDLCLELVISKANEAVETAKAAVAAAYGVYLPSEAPLPDQADSSTIDPEDAMRRGVWAEVNNAKARERAEAAKIEAEGAERVARAARAVRATEKTAADKAEVAVEAREEATAAAMRVAEASLTGAKRLEARLEAVATMAARAATRKAEAGLTGANRFDANAQAEARAGGWEEKMEEEREAERKAEDLLPSPEKMEDLKARARAEEAREELEEATKGSDIAELKSAIAKAAKEAGVDTEKVKAAEERLDELAAAKEAEARAKWNDETMAEWLASATEGSDIANLKRAIAKARQAGIAEATVAEAEAKLAELRTGVTLAAWLAAVSRAAGGVVDSIRL